MTPFVLLALFMVIICGVVSNTSVGYGYARLLDAETGSRAEPILRGSLARENQQAECENTNANTA